MKSINFFVPLEEFSNKYWRNFRLTITATAKALKTGFNYKSWWISENIIKMNNFIKIENIKTGEIYFENLKCVKKGEAK